MTIVDDIKLDISVLLGTTSMHIHQLLRMGRGAVIELDAHESDPVIILANNMPIAKGEIVVNGNRIGVEILEMLPASA